LQLQKGVKNTNPLKKNQKGLAGFFLSIFFVLGNVCTFVARIELKIDEVKIGASQTKTALLWIQ